jgi:K+/H+ antiporter YhaU regulatory subunit KhtT
VTLPSGDLDGLTLREAGVRERFGVTVVGIVRADGAVIVNPPADTVLRPRDRLRVFGLPDQIARMLAVAEPERPGPPDGTETDSLRGPGAPPQPR